MITVSNVTLKRGAQILFEDMSMTVHARQRAAIVGRNGIGKSTLFALLRGRLLPETGDVSLPADWRIAFLAQEVEASARTALEWVLDGDRELRKVEREIAAAEKSGDNHALASGYARYDDLDGYSANARAASILHGLGFSAEQFGDSYAQFSGGWRIRLNLAQALMAPSELLLLDEPTNHLDLDALVWLENWLLRYQGTLVTIAHDRAFLDNIATHVIHLEHRKAFVYRGGYSSFERQRAERLMHQEAEFVKQQHQAKHIQAFVDRFRAKASKARQVQSRLKALERLQSTAPAWSDSPYEFTFPNPERLPATLLEMDDGVLGYRGSQAGDGDGADDSHAAASERTRNLGYRGENDGGAESDGHAGSGDHKAADHAGTDDYQEIVDHKEIDNHVVIVGATRRIYPGSRIGILGANGAGKSTLVRTLAGELPLLAGELRIGERCHIGYFAQHQLEQLDGTKSAAAQLAELAGNAQPQVVRNFLGGWGFSGDMATRLVSSLSGGEKARLVLALLAWQRPAILLLDEPTNHLDLEMRHALSIALQDYTGALIIVAHDRELLARSVDEYWLVKDSGVSDYDGDIDTYLDAVRAGFAPDATPASPLAASSSAVGATGSRGAGGEGTVTGADAAAQPKPENPAKSAKQADASGASKRNQRQSAAEERRRTQPLRTDIKKLEDQMEAFSADLKQLEARLADTEVYQQLSSDEISSMLTERGRLVRKLETAERHWLAKQEALEEALSGAPASANQASGLS